MVSFRDYEINLLFLLLVKFHGSAEQVQLESSYSGSNRTAKLGSSFDFSWNYSGNLHRVEWGTKEKGIIALDVLLFILDRNGRLIPNVSQYNGRRFGSWNQHSPGQVMFTLKPIKAVDNQVFLFRFVPNNPLAPDVFDMVQLIVKGPPVVEIVPPALSTLKGVTASFTCNVKGFPLPNIVWMKQTGLGESEISASGVNVQINSHNDSSQLIVQNTSTTDSGYYICKASNFVSNTARAFLGVVSSYEDPDLCPTSFDATKGESVLMCCPVQGFPPPQVSWELPNRTRLETGSTILHVTVKTENDFGRYRCIARSLEKNVLMANITIHKRKIRSGAANSTVSLMSLLKSTSNEKYLTKTTRYTDEK
nr:immunoglobulin superfamily member 10-like isoform X3 [Pocillopora verrucosa]